MAVTIERPMPSFELKHKIENNSNPTAKKSTSKSIFSRIRRGGQNFKVRCKTSAELWRRWIRGGIYYDTNHKIVEEIADEEKVYLRVYYVKLMRINILSLNLSYCVNFVSLTLRKPKKMTLKLKPMMENRKLIMKIKRK